MCKQYELWVDKAIVGHLNIHTKFQSKWLHLIRGKLDIVMRCALLTPYDSNKT